MRRASDSVELTAWSHPHLSIPQVSTELRQSPSSVAMQGQLHNSPLDLKTFMAPSQILRKGRHSLL